MIAGENPDLPDFVKAGSIRVHAPTLAVLLCGGDANLGNPKPKSFRDALLRILDKTPLSKHDVHRVEEIQKPPPIGEYDELMKFERDVAQISDLLLLFSESAGSLVELGMFAADDEVAPRIMVVIDEKNYGEWSFVRLGPLHSLVRAYGEESVCVLTLADLKMYSSKDIADIDLAALQKVLDDPLKRRLAKRREPRTFDKRRNGHVTKLIVGIIQYYGALTLDEINTLLYCLDVPTSERDIKKHLMCAEAFEWILIEKKGVDIYYAAIADNAAIHFEFPAGVPKLNKERWQADIVEYWKLNDKNRFSVIAKAAAMSAR